MSQQKQIRVAVLSSYTIEPLVAALRVDGYTVGLTLEFHVAAYGRIFEEAMEASSALSTFQPDVMLVMLDVDALVPGFGVTVQRMRQRERADRRG